MSGDGILWAAPVGVEIEQGIKLHLPKPPAHIHCTLRYATGLKNHQHLIGQSFWVTAVEQAWNHRAEAMRLILPPEIYCQNTHPHITLALALDAGAIESNDMLADEARNRIPLNRRFEMQIQFLEWGRTDCIYKNQDDLEMRGEI